MGEKLNPCLACHSDDVSLDLSFGFAVVVCGDCGAEGDYFHLSHKHHGMWASDAAVKQWNGSLIAPEAK